MVTKSKESPYFDIIEGYERPEIGHITSQSMVDLSRSRAYVEVMVDSILLENRSGWSVISKKYGLVSKLMDDKEYKILLNAAFNTHITKFEKEDEQTIVDYMSDRILYGIDYRYFTVGDLMWLYSTKLSQKYGGPRRIWIENMVKTACFPNIMTTKTSVNPELGVILDSISRGKYWCKRGFGIFGDKRLDTFEKIVSFDSQYLAFCDKIDAGTF